MDHREFKTEINEQFARIVRAVANPHRLELVDVLAQGERSVEDLARETGLSMANASQHLQALRDAHFVTTRKKGLRVYYRLSDPAVFRLLQIIREIAERQLAEVGRIVDTYLTERASMEPVTLDELLARLHEPGLIVLDVRPALEYAQGRIRGARSLRLMNLKVVCTSYLPNTKSLPTVAALTAFLPTKQWKRSPLGVTKCAGCYRASRIGRWRSYPLRRAKGDRHDFQTNSAFPNRLCFVCVRLHRQR